MSYIAETQRELRKIIEKPTLKDELLQKPPISFIHAIVKSVHAATGFGEGLFSADQWDIENIKKDKKAKVAFLTRIQDAVCKALQEPPMMEIREVLSGKNPENTNTFLVALARAATQNEQTSAPEPARKPKREKKEKIRPPPPPKEEEPEVPRPQAPTPPHSPDELDTPAPVEPEIPPHIPPARPLSAKKKPVEQPAVRTVATKTVKATGKTEDKPRTAAAAPRVIQEGDETDDDDDLIIEDAPAAGGLDTLVGFGTTMGTDAAGPIIDDGEQHGMLVQNLLQAQTDLSSGIDAVPEGIVMQRDRSAKDREATKKEIEKLQESLQTLVRSANPLGRAMDYLHEDVESMTKEYDMWRAEARMHQNELNEAQRQTEETLEPLRRELGLLEEKLDEERAKINSMKASVLRGEEKLLKLLRLRTDR